MRNVVKTKHTKYMLILYNTEEETKRMRVNAYTDFKK